MSDQVTPVDDLDHLAVRLEEECPWETVSKVLSHEGWRDLLETMKAISPTAYAALRRDLIKPTPYFEMAKEIVRNHHAD